MAKKNLVVLFGGQSSEHEVSCMSAVNVIEQIDLHYEVYLIGITRQGRWLQVDQVEHIQDGSWREGSVEAVILPDAMKQCMLLKKPEGYEEIKIDVVFPILHGLYGEDGTVQGLLELAKIPYVGCGVLASAVSMDKIYTKVIVDTLGITQAAYKPIFVWQMKRNLEKVLNEIEETFAYPVFIKPSNAGSSVGISKAFNREELKVGLEEAGKHDRKILVEETIVGREIECSVFGGGEHPVRSSGLGEILAAAEFYDFDAKYNNEDSRTVVNPDIPAEIVEQVKKSAEDIFNAVDGYGLARVDFFVTKEGNVIFNEINTMPGFTAISMYPMLWEAVGLSKRLLVAKLVNLALERTKNEE